MACKEVGFFIGLSPEEQRDRINDLRRDEPHENEAEIINYLLNGFNAGVSMTLEEDVLRDPPKLLGEAILLSDNEWIWPASLAYYVREYHVELPPEFIKKMKNKGWRIPPTEKYIPDIPEGHIEM